MLNSIGERLAWLAIALYAVSCGTPGVVEVQRVETAGAAGPARPQPETPDVASACPSGWSCMNLSALGGGTDNEGQPVDASCSKGGITPCNDADPAASCAELPNPICVHLMVGTQALVSCGQRCAP